MAEMLESELVVVGGGPGGYAAAFLAADKGKQVTLIEARERPGGTCLHIGCIPSKALLHVAKLITEAEDGKHFGLDFGKPKINLDGVRGHWLKVVETMSKNLADLCKRRNVRYITAKAKFRDNQTLDLSTGQQLKFGDCILATGSLPARLKALDLPTPRLMDSTGALKLEEIPGTLLVIGGGYIGLELGFVYASLGSKVTVVEMTDGLLPGVDRTLVRPLHARVAKLFDKMLFQTKVTKLEDLGNSIRAHLEGPDVTDKQPVFDRVLMSVGRFPNSRELGLEKTKIQVDPRGFIQVDSIRRTAEEHIYAIGDVAGEPMLAHKASHEGKVAVEAILGEPTLFDPKAIPAVVFTDPEIAWAGLTQTEAEKQGRPVKIERFPWAASGRAHSIGRLEGLTQLLVDPEDETVLGVGIVGPGAGELISEAVLAIEMGAVAQDLALTIHPHPTLSETIMEAAEAVGGTCTHLYRPKK